MELKLWNKAKAWTKEFVGKINKTPTADFGGATIQGGTSRVLFTHSFNGEKNLGEIGPIKIYKMDYEALRYRSWQSYIESEITQTVVNRFSTWVVGNGLKLQAEPANIVLKANKINLDSNSFSEQVEAQFKVFRNSEGSDYANMNTLDESAFEAFVNSIVGGDVLVIMRYINGRICIQLVDGAHIQSPGFGSEWYPQALSNGNRIMNGIEVSSTGEHVAFYIRQENFTTIRVEAKGKDTGLKMAFMINGLKYRIDNVRCLPLISSVLETLKKLDRYKEATVGSAEERAKITYFIEQDQNSSDQDPRLKSFTKAYDYDPNSDNLPKDISGKDLANNVQATTNKTTFFMGIGQTLKALESKNELFFKEFYTVNIGLVCSALGIPYQVAMSIYEGNFSASRAALKDWENTLSVKRKKFAKEFYQPIFNFWLEVKILENKVDAPGYLMARLQGNEEVVEAYRNVRFVGTPVPHIDPLKEVAAARLKLGTSGAALPLSTLEAETEALGGGESRANLEQYADELSESLLKKIVAPIINTPGSNPQPTGEE